MYKCDPDGVLGILFGHSYCWYIFDVVCLTIYNKGNNKITELRTILQRESKNS